MSVSGTIFERDDIITTDTRGPDPAVSASARLRKGQSERGSFE